MVDVVESLAQDLSLARALPRIAALFPEHQILADWWQGEFHHDLVIGGLAPSGGTETLVLACN